MICTGIRFRRQVSLLHASIFIGTAVLTASFLADPASGVDRSSAGKKVGNTAAARLVDQAREAELEGDTAQQFALLREAVRLAPDYQAARWQLGQLEVDGEWLAAEEIDAGPRVIRSNHSIASSRRTGQRSTWTISACAVVH